MNNERLSTQELFDSYMMLLIEERSVEERKMKTAHRKEYKETVRQQDIELQEMKDKRMLKRFDVGLKKQHIMMEVNQLKCRCWMKKEQERLAESFRDKWKDKMDQEKVIFSNFL
jgi:hypothetical protein